MFETMRRTKSTRHSAWPSWRASSATRILGLCALAAALLAALPIPEGGDAATSDPLPKKEDVRSIGTPTIDWAYWTSVNPDVVGWIEIPDTPINGPIVQAPIEDPDYYLSHDVYRQPSTHGCFYLDAACSEGLNSPNCIISGHNMADGSMFAAVRGYLDATYAAAHRSIVLSEPNSTRLLEVVAARTIDGREPAKRTLFASNALLRAWLAEQITEAATVLDIPTTNEVNRVTTLVTCMPGGERRALVFAVE